MDTGQCAVLFGFQIFSMDIAVGSADVRDWLGHYSDHPHPWVVDMGTPSRVDKRVAPDRRVLRTNNAKEKKNSDHNM